MIEYSINVQMRLDNIQSKLGRISMKPEFFKSRHLTKLYVYLILKNQGLFGGPKNQFHRTISGPPEAVNFYTRIIMVRPTKTVDKTKNEK